VTDFAPQGSEEWVRQRLGKVTASEFETAIKQPRSAADKKAGKLGKSAQTYMHALLGERLTGKPRDVPETFAMKHGNTMEPFAVAVYEALTGYKCREVGFIEHPTEKGIGCSPDRLIGDDGGLEIKCPLHPHIHLGYLLGGVLPKEHTDQVLGGLWITGRYWWDFISYHEDFPDTKLAIFRVRVFRDEYEKQISELSTRVIAFRDALDAAHSKLTEGLNP
jgi:hypothetical protein